MVVACPKCPGCGVDPSLMHLSGCSVQREIIAAAEAHDALVSSWLRIYSKYWWGAAEYDVYRALHDE